MSLLKPNRHNPPSDQISQLQHSEGIVFGNGSHLPDATALEGFDFTNNLISVDLAPLKRQPEIALHPDHPDAVVRLHSIYNTEDPFPLYYARVTEGIRHFSLLKKAGIQLPGQRFVTSNQVANLPWGKTGNHFLFSVVERLNGRMLTSAPDDAQASYDIINKLAHYTLMVWYGPRASRILADIINPRQYTVPSAQPAQPILHDVELLFSSFNQSHTADIAAIEHELSKWCQNAGVDAPDHLKELKKASKRSVRAFRRFHR